MIISILSIFRAKTLLLAIIFLLSLLNTSCTSIGRMISTPNYSHHSVDKILLNATGDKKSYSVYIKSANNGNTTNDKACEMDSGCFLTHKANKQIVNLFDNADISITDKPEKADYVISVDVRNVVDELDADYAKKMRNSFLQYGVIGDYMFDSNNNPHIFTQQKFDISKDSQNSGIFISRRKSILPSVLYTFIGAGTGFVAGYFIGSVSPIAIGFAGAVLVGGLTYAIYSSFKDVGVAVVYDISISKKLNQTIKQNRKSVVKLSGNVSEEHYYTLDDNMERYVSRNAIIAIGSKAIRRDMLLRMSTMMANGIADTFGVKR